MQLWPKRGGGRLWLGWGRGGDVWPKGWSCHKVNKNTQFLGTASRISLHTHTRASVAGSSVGCQTNRKWNHCQFIKLSKNVTNCIYICCSLTLVHPGTHTQPETQIQTRTQTHARLAITASIMLHCKRRRLTHIGRVALRKIIYTLLIIN